ncbi:phage tail length tape measure family protein, partial [Enterococcus faecalis]|uniref:phage tail length tape measure family protein n=2 Tax=Bacteria TaxID=2 RepID=UPI00163DE4B8
MSGDELAGSVVYEVRAEVQPLLQGGNQVNKILSEIESSLDANIAQFKKMDTQVSATAQGVNQSVRSFGGFQNALRQSGYQIQDFIVQVQGGQSALVALSQQGSQLLGVFGTGGAVAGALLTLGTVIVGSLIAGMDNASVSTKALTDSQKRLADIFQITANGVVVLSDKFAKLAETSENAARAQLTIALIDAQNIIKSSVQSVNDLGDALGTWKAPLSAAISQLDALKARGSDVNSILKELGGTYEGNIIGLNQLNQVVGEISTAFGISANDAVKLVQALADVRHNANPDTIAALRDVTVDLSQKYGYANKSLSEFTGKVGEYSLKADQAAESTRLATEMLQGHKVASEADTEAIAQNTQRLQTYIQMIKDEGATIAMTARQRALYRAEQLGATEEDKKAINSSFDKIDAFKAEQQAQKTAAKESRRSASQSAGEAKKLASQQDSIAQKLEQLRQKAMLAADSSQELSREQSILSAQQSLGKGATQEQIALA